MAKDADNAGTEPEDFSDLNNPPGELDLPPGSTHPTPPLASPAAAPPATIPSAHPAALVQAARQLGIREGVIEALSTDSLLEHTLDLQRKLSFLDTADARQRWNEPTRQQQVEPQRDPEDSDEEVLTYLEKDVGADPKLVNMLRKRFQKQDAFERQRNERDEIESLQRQATVEEAIDDTILGLGPKAEAILGKGRFRDLAKGSAEQQARLDLYKAAGITNMDSERTAARKYNAVALRLLGAVLKAQEPSPAQNAYEQPNGKAAKLTSEEWDRGGVSKPTGTKPAKSRGQKAAAEAIRDQMAEWGIGPGSSADEYDSIPN